MKNNTDQTRLEAHSIESWFEDYEVVTLPSGKKAGLREVDVLHLISDDGDIPNVLLQQLKGHLEGEQTTPQPTPEETSMDDMMGYKKFLDKVVLACWVMPPVSQDRAKIEAREAIGLHMISIQDKSALIAWCMGGKAQVEASTKFLAEQATHLEPVQPGKTVRTNPKRHPRHS